MPEETIKCTCSHCGAKYRLPLEAQGRTAKCKRCGEKFQVPRKQSLEDTVLDWLGTRDDDDEPVVPPRVISMPHEESEQGDGAPRRRGPIRMKSTPTPDKEAEARSK